MYPRHRLDIRTGDLLHGLVSVLRVRPVGGYETDLLSRCGLADAGLVTLSVRSAWDLLLSAVDWPAGSEVLVSAITHPDMVIILQAHGLRTVPVDLDPDTLGPRLVELEAAITPRTRAIMVVQLFGGRTDLAPVVALAERHGLSVLEDAAQAFAGPESLSAGQVDVSLVSFGMIKTATAAGGAIMTVRDPQLLAELRRRHDQWPVQTRRSYAVRLLKIAALLALGWPPTYGFFFRLCGRTGRDPDAVISLVSRTFATATPDQVEALLTRLRRRPAPALVAVLARRIRTFDHDRLRRRASDGERLAAALPAPLRSFGGGLLDRTHWLFPVVAPDPAQVVVALRRAGLDTSRSTSNLVAVTGADGRSPAWADSTLASVVYLPAYPELPVRARRRLVHELGQLDRRWREPVDSARVGLRPARRARRH